MFHISDDMPQLPKYLYSTSDSFPVDEDFILEVDTITQFQHQKLYSRDVFKRRSKTIEIVYPTLSHMGNRLTKKGPNYVRFLLSLYPYQSDLELVDKIILCPRYVAINNIEIVAIYLRRKKIIVEYLHHPFYYEPENSKFNEYTEFLPLDITKIHNTSLATKSPTTLHNKLRIPFLWYVISLIESTPNDLIDKFFLKRNDPPDQRIIETSFFYSRHGY